MPEQVLVAASFSFWDVVRAIALIGPPTQRTCSSTLVWKASEQDVAASFAGISWKNEMQCNSFHLLFPLRLPFPAHI